LTEHHFLIVYRRSTGELLEERELGEDRGLALRERFAREQAARGDADLEVVVLSALSRDALRRTHKRYFKNVEGLTKDLAKAASERQLTYDSTPSDVSSKKRT
jgi:hypothetical protein